MSKLLINNFKKKYEQLKVEFDKIQLEKELIESTNSEKIDREAKLKEVLKEAFKVLNEQNQILEQQRDEFEEVGIKFKKAYKKERNRSIQIFGKHNDLKLAKKEIEKQKEEIEKQRNKLAFQKKKITDSIEYASLIQHAILPPKEQIKDCIEDIFILYLPRDIVSGDFYFFEQKRNDLILVAADCTGHGVPGAFMSMLGVSMLSEIVNKGNYKNAADILDQLRDKLVTSLHQTGEKGEAKDGIDLALCCIDRNNHSMQYAGAHNPLVIIRDKQLIVKKGDRLPIGIHINYNKAFTNHIIKIEKGDIIYLYSDGYIDQMNEQGRKFLSKQFKEFLLEIHKLPLSKQKEILLDRFHEWQGNTTQLDDVLVIGFRIS